MLDFLTNVPTLLCFLVGVALLVIEVFLPGFGAAGIGGILLLGAAVTLSWIGFGPSAALILLLISVILLVVALLISMRSAKKGRLSRSKLILREEEHPQEEAPAAQPGQVGTAVTQLRPSGTIQLGKKRLEAFSQDGLIEPGAQIKVVACEGSRVTVGKISE